MEYAAKAHDVAVWFLPLLLLLRRRRARSRATGLQGVTRSYYSRRMLLEEIDVAGALWEGAVERGGG